MAENEDRSTDDLAEEVSPYRLEDFRKKGQVVQSRELSALVALLAAAVVAYVMAPLMQKQLMEFMQDVFRADFASKLDLGGTDVTKNLFIKALKIVIAIGLPVSAAGFIAGVAASYSQVGNIFSFDPITPDLNKVNPLNGIKRYFSMKIVFEGLRLTGKTLVVGFVAYSIVKTQVSVAPAEVGLEVQSMLSRHSHVAKLVFFSLFSVLVVFAVIDFFFQRWEFSKKLRPTKQEAKQESKEREGDPQIKARVRAIQREMARKRMMQAVRRADVVITNPTHIAVAIIYEKDKMSAPRVVAKGADFLAQRIKKVAADAGVPMVENVPLARTLYKTVKVGQFVPRVLYQVVAEVLAYVYRLKRKDL